MPSGVYGHEIVGDLPLARLREGAMPRGRIEVGRTQRPLLDDPAEIIQLVESEEAHGIGFALGRVGDTFQAWCAHTGAYHVDPGRGLILSDATAEPAATEDRLLNAMIPLVLLARGELVLHGAAVRAPAGAVLVCGPSGRGKSTLAAVLGALGFPVLAEDSLVVELAAGQAWLWPGPVGVRLDRATGDRLATRLHDGPEIRGKRTHLPPGEREAGAVPVAAIVCLERRAGVRPRFRPLTGPDALARLFPSVLRLDIDGVPGMFTRAAQLVRAVGVLAARMPDDLDLLPAAAGRLASAAAARAAELRAA